MNNVLETVYVVEDDESIRSSLRSLFNSIGTRVRVYANAQEFLDAHEPTEPGCIVLDIRLPAMSGLQLQDTLRSRGVDIPIIFMSAYADVPITVKAIKAGGTDVIEKPFSESVLLEKVQNALFEHRAHRSRVSTVNNFKQRIEKLTPRELEVARLVACGKSSKEIAADLSISTRTVELHRFRGLRKVGARNAAELVRILTNIPVA